MRLILLVGTMFLASARAWSLPSAVSTKFIQVDQLASGISDALALSGPYTDKVNDAVSFSKLTAGSWEDYIAGVISDNTGLQYAGFIVNTKNLVMAARSYTAAQAAGTADMAGLIELLDNIASVAADVEKTAFAVTRPGQPAPAKAALSAIRLFTKTLPDIGVLSGNITAADLSSMPALLAGIASQAGVTEIVIAAIKDKLGAG